MNFVQNLEECLRDLAAASRQKHPGVKEASERAITKLRVLQNSYVSAVRKANDGNHHPTTKLFQNSEILHPFLLAANYPNADFKMLEVSFKSLRLLMEADAIVPSDAIHMIRVYQIQAQVVSAYYHKIFHKEIQKSEENLNQPEETSSSSSWFGWGSGSSVKPGSIQRSTSSSSGQMKNAVSSSRGKTGQASLSSTHMEKLALEILSSLLQLMELLRNYPSSMTVELWTNAVALACLWFYLPRNHTVLQAAQATVSQIISLLFQSKEKLQQATWEDLLSLTDQRKQRTFAGAFQLCKIRDGSEQATNISIAPSPELALELMTEVLAVYDKPEPILLKSMGVTMNLLKQIPRLSVERSLRIMQWTLAFFQKYKSYSTECRELLLQMIKEIVASTDACRSHHDFEDGYVYTEPIALDESSAGERTTCIPSDVLWKAGFVLEAIYHILDENDQVLCVHELTEALSDFATISTSCRDHILQVVDYCDNINPSSIKPTIFRRAEQHAKVPILGEIVWLSLQGILRIGECIQKSNGERFNEIFSPSLAVFQHFLKRFVGSKELVDLALSGYTTLAKICLPIKDCEVERKVLITSLSKLSLPAWGKRDVASQLQDHHIRSLLCLLRIVHQDYDCISEWDIVMWTLEELSVLDIASPLLSEEAYHASLALSAVYGRLAQFSTCFSDESYLMLTQALVEICESTMAKRDVVGDSETVLPERRIRTSSNDHAEKGEGSFSGKIMSIGVRAIYGNTTDGDKADPSTKQDRTKKAYYEDYRSDFLNRLSSSNARIRTSAIGLIPFALALLSDVTMANIHRSKKCNESVAVLFAGLAATSPAIRPFVMDMTTTLMMYKLSADRDLPLPCKGSGKIVVEDPMHSQLLAAEPSDSGFSLDKSTFSQSEVLSPLCNTIRSTENAEVAKAELGVLNTIIEGTGQTMRGDVWPIMIDAIASLSGDSSYSINRSSSEWSECCLLAFRNLKLIVDDFLDLLPSATGESATASLLDCCSSFVVSRHDVNTSLTAIGLLWTIADRDSDSAAIDRALSKLVLIVSDDRPEVRNAAVNTLFSCIAGRGSGFSATYWKSCIMGSVFKVYNIVASKTGVAEESTGEEASKYKVQLHHSRDSAEKMWIATLVLVLRGLTRVLRNFFTQLLITVEEAEGDARWFPSAWTKILRFAYDAASQEGGRDTFDIRATGIELLVVCCQLASEAGIQAAVTPARVGTHMEVVNGALRSVREAHTQKVELEQNISRTAERVREELFREAFNALEAYIEEMRSEAVDSDDTDQQILNKLCGHLSKLYDCCQEYEFRVDNAARSLGAIKKLGSDATCSAPGERDSRFVSMVESVIHSSGGDPKARFLNQGLRGSLDLLRFMAADGSALSFERLVHLAGSSFFIHKDAEGEETESGEEDITKHQPTLLSFEAASAVSHELQNGNVTDECRVFVLCIVLADFLAEYEEHNSRRIYDTKSRRYYKRFVPVLRSGLESAARLNATKRDQMLEATDTVWRQALKCFAHMLTPIPLRKSRLKIPRIPELLTIIGCAVANVPRGHAVALCGVLSYGATNAFKAAKLHAINAETNQESGLGKKSRRHRDDLLKLFSSCFSGSCSLGPEATGLREIADTVLMGAIANTSEEAIQSLCAEAGTLVCDAIHENKKMDALIVSIFAALCQIIVSDRSSLKLKEAAGSVLTVANIAETLQTAQTRYEDAERRAEEASERARQLAVAVDELRIEKSKLQRQVEENKRGSMWSLG